jgi:hypothetical protein
MTEQEERVKEALDELVEEVARVAGEQDGALSGLNVCLGWLEDQCETLRDVLGNVEVVADLEACVSDAQAAADELGSLVEELAGLGDSAVAVASSDDGGNNDE